MVKRGGTKRKVEIKKITDKNTKATTFTKRRDGLFSKAAQLCVLNDAQIAILATPSSSHSNVSFFSFGHSSVDSLVAAYLSGQRPAPPVPEDSNENREDIGICMARKDLGLGCWWEDEKLATSKDPQEIMNAIESIKILLKAAERLPVADVVDFDQNLITTENYLIMSVSDSFCNYNNPALSDQENSQDWSNMDLEQLLSDNLHDEKTEKEDDNHQIEAVSCSNNNALLVPAEGKLDDQNLFDLDLANVDLDTVFEGLPNLDDEFLASFLMS